VKKFVVGFEVLPFTNANATNVNYL